MSSQESKLLEHAIDTPFGPLNVASRGRGHTGSPTNTHGNNGERRRIPRSSNCSPRRRPNRKRNNPDYSMFQSARNIVVSHATFTNQQTVHVHKESSQNLEDSPDKASLSPSKSDKESTPTDQPEYDESSSTHPQSDSSTRRPIRKTDAEVYQELINEPKARGKALHTPQPYSQLPKEYRAKGVSIGDVGVFTPEGGFDFLFNILLPASDKANPEVLPLDFSPLSPPLKPVDVRKFKEFSSGSHLVSPNVSPVKAGTSTDSGTVFQSSVANGAILIMPDGASAEELSNLPIFHKYIKDNAHNFYDFARNVRGRAIKNGQLHIVYGCRKTTSWGIATFTDTSNLRLEFLPDQRAEGNGTLSWNYTMKRGTANVKAGPDAEDNEDLGGAENGVRPKNQCLFASTLSIRLGNRPRNRRQHKGSLSQRVSENDSSSTSYQPSASSSVNSQTSASGSGTLGGPVEEQERSSNLPRGNNTYIYSTPHDANEPQGMEDSFDEYDNEVIIEQELPSVYPTCPSEVLTEHLLRVAPNAALAIASDRDLAGCMLSEDPRTLIDNVSALNSVREEDGIVFFEPKEYQPPQEDIKRIIQPISTGEFDVEKYLFGPLGRRYLDPMLYSSTGTGSLSSLNQFDTSGSQRYTPRPVSLDQIMDFCSRSFDKRASMPLAPRQSITDLRRKLREERNLVPNADAQIIRSLAESLLLRFTGFSQQEDLDEAIWLFEHALTVTDEQTYQYLEVLSNLSISLAARYRLSKQPHDYDRLVECNSLIQNMDIDKLLSPVRNAVSLLHLASSSRGETPDVPSSRLSNEYNSTKKIPEQRNNTEFRPYEAVLEGRKKALLIGISYAGTSRQLRGPINDACRMKDFLKESMGYMEEDIVVLADDGCETLMPTRKNILHEMKKLMQGAESGDSLLFHFSGHGGALDVQLDEENGMNEFICPVDYLTSGPIVDDELQDILVKPLPKGCHLTALIDTCHSGIVLDLPYKASRNLKNDDSGVHVSKKWMNEGAKADVVIFSARQDKDEKPDAGFSTPRTGSLTNIFIDALKEKLVQTYDELFHTISERMGAKSGCWQRLVFSACYNNVDTRQRILV